MKKILYILAFIFFGLFGVVNEGWSTTYKLTQVTNVSVGNKYVFVHNGYALTGSINQNKVQSTNSYNTTSLIGTESYVWVLESATSGYKIKNPYNSNKYLNNVSKTNMTFDTLSTANWVFTFTDNYALITNTNNNNRFIGETSNNSHEYKAYASSNLEDYNHDILVYRLDEEEYTGTYTITFVNNNTNETYESEPIESGQYDITEVADDYMLWEFDGWGTDSTDYLSVTSRINLTSDTTLYAFFKYGNYGYVLVEREPNAWDGEYLIVNHDSVVAFDGGLSTLDATYDTINVSIENKTIKVNSSTELAQFTITSKTGGYSILSESGKYIGRTTNKNGLDESVNDDYVNTIIFRTSDTIDIVSSNGAHLRFNGNKDQVRFRFFKSDTYTNQKPIQLYKKTLADLYCTNPSNIQMVEWLKDSIKLNINNYDSIKIGDDWELLTTEQDGTHKVYVENLQNKSCTDLVVKTRKDDRTDCINVFKIPIFAGQYNEIDNEDCNVVILKDSIFTPSNGIENKDVMIYPKGTLVIPNGTTYTVNSLTLRKDNNDVPQFKYNGTLNTDKLYFELRTDGTDWRWLTLPDTFNTELVNDPTEVVVKYYDGSIRASNGKGGWQEQWWNDSKHYTKKFAPGEGCIFGIDIPNISKKHIYQIPLTVDSLKNEKSNKRIRIYANIGTSGHLNDYGWNLVGNPYMTSYNIGGDEFDGVLQTDSLIKEMNGDQWTGRWIPSGNKTNLRYIVIPSWDTQEEMDAGGYKQVCLQNGYIIEPFTSFFIQANNDGVLEFTNSNKVSSPSRMKSNANKEVFLQINVGSIKTGCYISNKFTDDYEIGDDMESLYQTYQLINGYKLLYSAINDSIINNGVTVYTTSGNLTLDEKTDVNEFSEINVLYNGHWYDLLHGETLNVSGSFILQAARNQNDTPTGLNETIINAGVKKFIHNGYIYVVRDNETYSILGEKIR